MPVSTTATDSPMQNIDSLFDKLHIKDKRPMKEVLSEILSIHKNKFDGSANEKSKIPYLSTETFSRIPSGNFVRLRGMIQDMHGPEFFNSSFESRHKLKPGQKMKHSGLFRDVFQCPTDHELDLSYQGNILSERQLYTVIPIPGLSDWAYPELIKYNANNDNAATSSEVMSLHNTESQGNKRPLDEEQDLNSEKRRPSADLDRDLSTPVAEKDEKTSEVYKNWKKELSPIAMNEDEEKMYLPALVKMYGDESDSIKLNECYDFVGVVQNADFQFPEEDQERANEGNGQGVVIPEEIAPTPFPPASLLPRLHVLYAKKLDSTDLLNGVSNRTEEFEGTRRKLLEVLTTLFGGDSLAAEYFLLLLLSSVEKRRGGKVVGHLSLNLHLRTMNPSAVQAIAGFVRKILPKVHCFGLSVEGLNENSVVPKKDAARDKLLTGPLQLSDGTLLILDETKMTAGQLHEQGVRNLKSLQDLMDVQTVYYDFQFHGVPFECDIPVFILSEGKSLLVTSISVPMKTSDGANVGCCPEIDDDLLREFRNYLMNAKKLEYNIPNDVQDTIQQDFINMRPETSAARVEKLDELLRVARLVSSSNGCTELTSENWKRAKVLDSLRTARLGS